MSFASGHSRGLIGTRGPRCLGVAAWLALALVVLCGGCSFRSAVVKKESDAKPLTASFIPSSSSWTKLCTTDCQQPTEPAKAEVSGSTTQTQATAPKKKPSYPPVPISADDRKTRDFIRRYAYEDRNTMKQYMARAEHLLPMVKAVAVENGVPEDLAYLFMLESGANPEARSRANALGMWQFMPATARSYGLRVDSWVDERLDPARSTEAAMLYLKDLYGMFGCWRLALSAYNSGENKLNRVLCQEDAAEYEEICNSKRLRPETKEFFPKFQAIAIIAKSPERYGFAPLLQKPHERNSETIQVDQSYSLTTLANLIGTDEEELGKLNPALHRGMTPRTGPSFALKVPVGTRQALRAGLRKTPSEKPSGDKVHVVAHGDTIHKIMKRYHVSRAELANLNPDVNLNPPPQRNRRVRPLPKGVRLVVPAPPKVPVRRGPDKRKLSALNPDENS
ncbi:MAG: transglycosylase SLT domain-containing protein [Thermodesulfobacteriota bacterium]